MTQQSATPHNPPRLPKVRPGCVLRCVVPPTAPERRQSANGIRDREKPRIGVSARGQPVSDITYIPTAEGWLYLAVVIDLFSRCVLG